MPKPDSITKDLESKKKLPDVVEQKFDGWGDAVVLLEKLNSLKAQVGRKPDNKKGKEGTGLLAEIEDVATQLSAIMAVEGLNGLRHNNLVFSDTWIEGRESVDLKALKIELVQAGVDLTLVNECIQKCTKTGEGYVRRMLTDLDKPRGGGWDE